MASTSAVVDPVSLLTTALSAPADEQRAHLQRASVVLQAHPQQIQTILNYVLPFSKTHGIITTWTVELVEIAVCRSALPLDTKTQIAVQSLDVLANLVPTAPVKVAKLLVQVFASIYPLVFKYLWTNRTVPELWTTLAAVKARILSWATTGNDEDGKPINKGLRTQAIKFLQRAVLVQTKGTTDPRLRVSATDPNLAQCPANHPFIPVAALDAEGNKLLEFLLLSLYTSTDVDVLTAVVNTLPPIVKARPTLVPVFVPALTGWTPGPISGLPRGEVRSVEKVVKVAMSHLEKSPVAASERALLQDALARQAARMDAAYKLALEESRVQIQKRKLDEVAAATAATAAAVEEEPRKPKRQRWDVPGPLAPTPPPQQYNSSFPPFPPGGSQPAGMPPPTLQPSFPNGPPPPHPNHGPPPPLQSAPAGPLVDVSSIAVETVIGFVLASLTAVSEAALVDAVRAVRRSLFPPPNGPPPPQASLLLRDAVLPPGGSGPGGPPERGAVGMNGELKQEEMNLEMEAVNPMDMVGAEDEEVELSPDELEALMIKNKKRKQPNDDSTSEVASRPHPSASAPSNAIPKFLQFQLSNFALPPPTALAPSVRQSIALKTLRRIWESGAVGSRAVGEDEEIPSSAPERKLWMMLGSRLVTRAGGSILDQGAKKEEEDAEEGRSTVVQFVVEDFGTRYKFATLWLNEEWYNDSQISDEDERRPPLYRTCLSLLINAYLPRLSGTYFSRFILDLPDIPLEVLSLLQKLCTDPDRSRGRVGLKALRDLVLERPPLREDALRILLELCTHRDAGTRNPAIATVRSWVPDNKPWSATIRTFALQLLRRLQASSAAIKEVVDQEEEKMEDDTDVHAAVQEEADQIAESQYLPVKLETPVEPDVVRQHVELLFALTKKIPEFLDEIFAAYVTLNPSIQDAFRTILSPLLKSLGPNHGKLLTLLRTFPPGADALALRTLHILVEPKDADTARVKPSVPLVALVKSLVAERDTLDPRFILPILSELDKTEVRKHLPRIVSILCGKPAERELFRQVVFTLVNSPVSVLPAHQPRLRPDQQFSPAELLVTLHRNEKEAGLKPTMEAIDICFSITEVYRSEVLGVVLQQISDEQELPTLFLRTVIKSVQTYKSLTPFVATNLLSRLITKKIWTSPQLWEGFIRVSKILGPASYGALLQLPREQLKEIVTREDGKAAKAGLREFVVKKAGGTTARLPAWFAEIFGNQTLPIVAPGSPSPAPGTPTLGAATPPVGGADAPASSGALTPISTSGGAATPVSGGGGVEATGTEEADEDAMDVEA